jgi:hypothetical protein
VEYRTELKLEEISKLVDDGDAVEDADELVTPGVSEDDDSVDEIDDPTSAVVVDCEATEEEEDLVDVDDDFVDDIFVEEAEEVLVDVDDETAREDETSGLHWPKPFWHPSPQYAFVLPL